MMARPSPEPPVSRIRFADILPTSSCRTCCSISSREISGLPTPASARSIVQKSRRSSLDSTIGFKSLAPETVGLVVDKFVMQLEEQLADRGVTIELDDAARSWLADKGYDQRFGARPLARVIQEHLKKPLSDELLFGKLVKGGSVVVKMGKDGKLSFQIRKSPGRRGGGGRKSAKEPALVE